MIAVAVSHLLFTLCLYQRVVAGLSPLVPLSSTAKQDKSAAAPLHCRLVSRKSFGQRFGQSFLSIWTSSSKPSAENALAFQPIKTELIQPFASVESLLPAVRVKLLIENGIDIVSKLKCGQTSDANAAFSELSDLLLAPHNFTKDAPLTTIPASPAQQYLKSYDDSRRTLPLIAQPGAILVQQGEIMTWKRLKKREQASEREDEIRAALNVYTNALEYDSTKYALTASPEKRRQLIRNDALPDVKSVIASDMGLRYLYRNELLSRMDEARAELRYLQDTSRHRNEGIIDVGELLDLLILSNEACKSWLSFIDPQDVQKALDIVKSEENQLRP